MSSSQKSALNYTYIICFFLLLIHFSVWSLIRPPYQSPDEFAHHVKSFSVTLNPWLPVHKPLMSHERFLNPLIYHGILHTIPHSAQHAVTDADIDAMKGLTWANNQSWKEVVSDSRADWYPVLYYWSVFSIGQSATEIFNLSPYESFYSYRLASSLLSAFLWTYFFIVLSRTDFLKQYKLPAFIFIVITPSLAAIGSTINPDAMLNPLTSILIVYCYQLFQNNKCMPEAVFFLLAALYTKATGVFLLPSIVCCALLVCISKRSVKPLINCAVLTGFCSLIAYFSFYSLIEPQRLIADPGKHIPLLDYIRGTPARANWMFHMFCGILGWLEYGVERMHTNIFMGIVSLNILCVLVYLKSWFRLKTPPFSFLFLLVFTFVLFFMEYYNAAKVGLVLQGRYFLPGILGLAVIMMHRIKLARLAMLAIVVFLNFYLLNASIQRYYSGSRIRLIKSLPVNISDDKLLEIKRLAS